MAVVEVAEPVAEERIELRFVPVLEWAVPFSAVRGLASTLS